MKVTQEKLERSQVGLQVEVPADQVKTYYEKAINDLKSKASIPGFRKGKVPRPIILQRFGLEQIKGMAIEALLDKTLPQAVEQAEVKAIGNLQVVSEFSDMLAQFKTDSAFVYKARVDVLPETKIAKYQDLAVTAEEEVVAEDAVDKFLADRQREKATLVPVADRPVQLGDVTVVDYSGVLVDGTEINGGQATDAEMEISPDHFIEDLVNGMVGMKIGDTKEIPVTFPEKYGREDLAGQAAKFTVTLKDLKVKELPALDDDFAQEISEQETIAALRKDLTDKFEQQATDRTTSNIEEAIAAYLVGITTVDLPETLIDQETSQILQMMANQFSQYGMDVNQLFTREAMPKMRENCRPDAIKNLTKNLAMLEIGRMEKVELEPADIEARMFTIRQQLEGQADEERLRAYVTEDLTKEKVMEILRSTAKVTLVPAGSLKKEGEEEAVAAE